MKIQLNADTVIDGNVTFEVGDVVELNGYRFEVTGTVTIDDAREMSIGFDHASGRVHAVDEVAR